jgi:hypothetical protein
MPQASAERSRPDSEECAARVRPCFACWRPNFEAAEFCRFCGAEQPAASGSPTRRVLIVRSSGFKSFDGEYRAFRYVIDVELRPALPPPHYVASITQLVRGRDGNPAEDVVSPIGEQCGATLEEALSKATSALQAWIDAQPMGPA